MFSFNAKKELTEKQRSIHNGAEIFEAIKSHLQQAQSSIKVAAAWFTDYELFRIILQKRALNSNCKVEIVLDDNKENYWLPFIDLVKQGATVKLSKGLGTNGRMHEKFCIVDERVLISGSYNWSKNARTDNHENVIVSEIPSTVQDFIAKFNMLLEGSNPYESINLQQTEVTPEEALEAINEQERFTKEFEKVLDQMIYAAVVDYDRTSLVAQGFDRSHKCLGDSNIINYELNTVYTELMNSISVSEQRKETLKAKVKTHLEQNTSALKEQFGNNKEQLQLEEELEIKALGKRIDYLKEENKILKEEITIIEKSDLVAIDNNAKELNREKGLIESDTVKMPFRWYVDVPTYFALFGVFAYIVLFYSSAAYILMFSERDAKAAKLLGNRIEEVGIYYSKALSTSLANGWSEIGLILFVPFFLICGIIYLKKLTTPSYLPKWVVKFICLVLVDGFTAIAVTKSLHENNYLRGLETEHFKMSNLFSDMNFYLVFVFGMLALLIFDLVISYLLKSFETKNVVHSNARKRIRISEINSELARLANLSGEFNAKIANKKNTIEHNAQTSLTIEKEIQLQPGVTNRKVLLLENQLNSQITNLENIVTIAYSKIENELFSFSSHFMKDRINIFLQGWNNFIYSFYATSIAEDKVQAAKAISANWLADHLPVTNN